MKMTKIEDDQNGRQPKQKTTKLKKIRNETELEAQIFQGHPD